MSLFIGFSFFLLEIVILLICYELIYRKKNLVNWTVIDFLKALTKYYFSSVKYKLRPSARNHDMDEFMENNSELSSVLWEYTVFGGMLLIFLPGIITLLIKNIQLPFFNVIIYFSGIGVLLDRLKHSRIDLIYLLNESHKFLFRYHKMSAQIRAKEKEGGTADQGIVENGLKNRVIILVVSWLMICGCLLLGLISINFIEGETLKNFNLKKAISFSPFFAILLLILYIVYIWNKGAGEKVKQGISYWKYIKSKSDIEVWIPEENRKELNNWIDETLGMCDLLKVKEVGIGIGDIGMKKVLSSVSYTHMPIIIIGSEVFEKSKRLYPQEHFEIIRMLIAHELVHIHYRDAKWMKKVYAIALIYIGCAACAPITIAANLNLALGSVTVLLLLFLDMAVFRILRDERYWKQIMEFRADRVGMAISHTTPDLLEKVLACTGEDEKEDKKHERVNIVHKIYQRKIEQPVHPDTERRIYEARRQKPWGIGEYFRYLWMIIKNLFMGKGWRV